MRVYRLSSQLWYTLVAYALFLTRLGFAIAILVCGLPLTLPDYVGQYLWLLTANGGLGAIIDIWNTIAMCYWLSKAQKEIDIKRHVFKAPCIT